MTMTRSRPLPLLDEVASPSRLRLTVRARRRLRRPRDLAVAACPWRRWMCTGRIDGLLSQVTVRQTFVNATGEPLEATYIFPLPDRAAVTDFRMEVAGRRGRGRAQGARAGAA